MRAIYTLNIFLFGFAIRIASVFNQKAQRWIRGRKDLFATLEKKLAAGSGPVAWFHCASLGEFEQGRPVMEQFKKENPQYRILLSFFSPSGYEVRKNYPGADVITYLPLDTRGKAKRFVATVNPAVVFFIKYEFWLNHLAELREREIPHFLVSAVFRPDQQFFKSTGKIFRDALKGYAHIFTQDENSLKLLGTINISRASVAGDTRFDRVIEIASQAKDIPVAAAFAENANVIVAGSSWPEDERRLLPALKKHFSQWKLLVAPHELSEEHYKSIENLLAAENIDTQKIVRFSKTDPAAAKNARVLIIDNMGMLSSLYRYGKIAYIGGGFGKNIHNTLEAAVYGIPVVFGPQFQKFNEAKGLISCGGGFGVATTEELEKTIDALLSHEAEISEAGKKAGDYVRKNSGATKKILAGVSQILNH